MNRGRRRDAGGFALRDGAVLFLGALALRLAHVLAMRASPYFDHPIVDALTYHDAAKAIAAGHGHPDDVFWQPPGYPYFLGAIYALTGATNFLAPRLVQAILGAGSVVLTAWIGARLFGRGVGLAAGVGAAIYGMLIYYDGELLTPSLTVLLQLTAVAAAIRAGASKRPGPTWLLAGLAGGLASVVTATSLLMVAAFAVFARRRALWVALGAALAIAPVTARNVIKGHEWVPISYNAGINFYIGNQPHYDELVAIRPDRQWRELTKEPYRRGIVTRSGASTYFVGRVFEWAREDPAAFLRLQWKKLRLLAGGDEILRNQAIYPARAHSPVLAVLLWKVPGIAFPFGVLAPLGLLGMAVAWRRAPLLAALVGVYAFGVLAFFIAARYRVPLVPFLLVFAAAGVRWFAREASRRDRVVALAGILACYLAVNLGQGPMPRRMNADAEYALATNLILEKRMDEARVHLLEATDLAPDMIGAWVNLGVVEGQSGRYAEAARAFERALALDPNEMYALTNLAEIYAHEGRLAEAIELYTRAAEAEPTDAFTQRKLEALRRRAAETLPP